MPQDQVHKTHALWRKNLRTALQEEGSQDVPAQALLCARNHGPTACLHAHAQTQPRGHCWLTVLAAMQRIRGQ